MADIFDRLSQEKTPEKKTDIFDQLAEQQPSRPRSLISAPIKGALKEVTNLAAMSDPISYALGLRGTTPLQEQVIEKILPTREQPLEKGLERAGRLGISALGGGESALAKGARVLGGAALGQFAEEAGAPEWVQGLAELAAFMAPTGKFTPKPSQKEAVEFLRAKGFTDKEITPLIQSEKKLRRLLPLAEKSEKTQRLARDIGEKLGQNYELLKETGRKLPETALRGEKAVVFDDKLQDVLDKINPRFKRLISADLEDLRNRGLSADNLINFYQDINAVVKGQEGGKAVLNKLKSPILEGLKEIDPKIANEFEQLNKFYARKSALSKDLDPDALDMLLKKGKNYATMVSIATGNLKPLKAILTTKAIGRLFSELITNPKLQNLSDQMLKAIKSNKIPVLLNLYEQAKKEIKRHEIDVEEKQK